MRTSRLLVAIPLWFWCLLFRCSSTTTTVEALVVVSGNPSTMTTMMDPWVVRAVSAAVSYMGLVAFADRPRGTLEVDNGCLRVSPSTVKGAGLGLFCGRSMPRGTVLGTYPGTVMEIHQNLPKLRAHPACEAYVWRFSDSKMVIDPTDAQGRIRDYTCGGNPSTPGSFWICETLLSPLLRKPTTLCRTNEPPLGQDVNVYTREDLDKRTIQFILERDVVQGEELFIDYGISYNRAGYGGW